MVGSQWRITFLFILLHRQDLILRRILRLIRVLPTTGNRVQRLSLRRRGHGESHHGRSDKRDAEEYALLKGSSPRSELNHPAALTAWAHRARWRVGERLKRSSTEPWHASISASKTALNEKRTKARLVMCHCMESSERVEVLSFTLSVNFRFRYTRKIAYDINQLGPSVE